MESASSTSRKWYQVFSGRRGRDFREALLAYAMVAPSLLLIFTFGIFPVLFAVYVSLHKWKFLQGGFLGLDNYTEAIDNLAYLLFFALVLGLAFFAWRAIKDILAQSKKYDDTPWLLTLPAAIHAAAGLLFIRWLVYLLPEFLGIADLVRKVATAERTTAMYFSFFFDTLKLEHVAEAFLHWIVTWLVAWLVTGAVWRWVRNARTNVYLGRFATAWLFSAGAIITGWFTVREIQKAIQLSLETGEEVRIWVQIVTISSGVLLLFLAYRLWQNAVSQTSNRTFLFRSLAAIFLIIGGWLLAVEVPAVIDAGDEDLWLGLKVTAFYSFGTVPFQLVISLVLAIFLFQNIRGKEFFRVLFFLPYVTPAIASAAVFRLLFSTRPNGVVNSLFTTIGLGPQKWLIEPRGVFTIMAESFGIANFPDWAAGPSQALVVVIIYSIWVYVGYDVVIYLAGLGNISTEVNEAAEIDGASRWQIMRHITIPLLSPTIYFLSLIAVIGTFKAFNHIFIMRDALALGTIDTFSVAIFDQFYTGNRYGYASAMAFVLFAVILSLTYINNKVQGSRVFYG
jgi:multiple sugar transport system permease protein